MKKLSVEKMEKIEGGGWLACGSMVLWGVAAVASATTAVTGAGILVTAGLAAAMLDSADSCAQAQ